VPDDCVVFICHQSIPHRWLFFNHIVPAEEGHIREMGMAGFTNWWFYLRDFADAKQTAKP